MTVDLKRADREIAQPQIGEAAALPQPEQRPVERLPQQVVAALDRDADAFAEELALQERPAAEQAAIRRVGAVEPKGERNAVAEQEIDLATLEREARGGVGRIRMQLGFGEQRLQIGFVRGASDDRD